jgi:hypothetical protein
VRCEVFRVTLGTLQALYEVTSRVDRIECSSIAEACALLNVRFVGGSGRLSSCDLEAGCSSAHEATRQLDRPLFRMIKVQVQKFIFLYVFPYSLISLFLPTHSLVPAALQSAQVWRGWSRPLAVIKLVSPASSRRLCHVLGQIPRTFAVFTIFG